MLAAGRYLTLLWQQALTPTQGSIFLLKKVMVNAIMPIPKQMDNKITNGRQDFLKAPLALLAFLLINSCTGLSSFSTDHHSFFSAAAPGKPFSKTSLRPVTAWLWDLHNMKTNDLLSPQLQVFFDSLDERESEEQ